MAKRFIWALGMVAVCLGMAAAQDPGLPDSVLFGNLDRSIILAGLDADIVIPVWVKTDDSVAFLHVPLGTYNDYIVSRLGGTIYAPLTQWDDASFITPNVNYPIQGVTNQSLLGWSDIFGGPNPNLHTNYTWIKIAEFRMHTTGNVNVLGDTTEVFPGANPQNGTLGFSDPTGTLNWAPRAYYTKIFFPPNNPPVFNSPSGGSLNVDREFELDLVVDCTDPDTDQMTLQVDFSGAGYTFTQLLNVPGHIKYRFRWVVPPTGDTTYTLRFVANDGQGGIVDLVIDLHVGVAGLVIGSTSVIPGASFVLPVSLNNLGATSAVGAFEILVSWDPQALTLSSVTRTARLSTWEYFNVRMGDAGPGTARVVGVADWIGGPIRPPLGPGSGAIFNLNFAVASDEHLIGVTLPVAFLTQDVTDNTLADSTGYRLVHPQLTDGAVYVLGPGQALIGDINVNGVPYEAADLVLFVNHLVNPTGFPFTSVQVQATDINRDGITKTVADLVMLLNIINGNITPPLRPDLENVFAEFILTPHTTHSVAVDLRCATAVAGVLVRLDHTQASLIEVSNVCGLEMAWFDDGNVLSALLYDPTCQGLTAGEHRLLELTFSTTTSNLNWVELQAADPHGRVIQTRVVPDAYVLYDNYPNPFNRSTVIPFAIPRPGRVHVDIFDVGGRLVRRLVDSDFAAGRHELTWDGTDESSLAVASGIYFYRIKADDYIEVKKATLLK